ncbi:MAG: hypothetical protein ACHREM_09760 [Polyangiales bacterium]
MNELHWGGTRVAFFTAVMAFAIGVGCSSGVEGAAPADDGGHGGPDAAGPVVEDASTPPIADAGTTAHDSGVHPPGKDAGTPKPGTDSGSISPPSTSDAGTVTPSSDSGSTTPARNSSCTPLSKQTGTAVNTNHGRLDGTLVYVLPVDGSSSCNGDSAHVHLQIEVSGSVYDVAVDIGKSGDEVSWLQQTIAVPGGPWAEGWHGSDALGYSSLGLSSSAFTALSPSNMGMEVETLLAGTSKISIFCTGYTPGDNGCHDVHYQDGSSQDGAIVLDPTSPTSPIVFFRFSTQSF